MKQEEERKCARCKHYRGQYNPCGKQPLGIVSPYTECCSEFEEGCCGNCCWFCFECTDGEGQCAEVDNEGYPMMMTQCGSRACERFISRQQMRHHMAILLQANRYRRDDNVPAIHKMPNPKELGLAIDFAVKYMKTFGKL
jgi:hypothetical protein